jgi:hypothetical protein
MSAQTPRSRFDVAKAYLELQRIRRAVELEEAAVHLTRTLHPKRKPTNAGSKSQR